MTVTARFTPGPWTADEWDYPDGTDSRAWGSGWTILAADKTVAVALDQGNDKSESMANADLIAAAPELYKALRDLRDYCEGRFAEDNFPWATQYMRAATAALAAVTRTSTGGAAQ